MRKIIDLLIAKGESTPFFKQVLILMGGASAGQFLVFIAMPALSRLYTPDDFGVLAVFASFLPLYAVICLRYELAIPIAAEDQSAVNIMALCIVVAVTMSFALGIVFWLFRNVVAEILNLQSFEAYIMLVPFSLLAIGCYMPLNYWGIRKQNYALVAKTKLGQSIGQVATQIILGMFSIGPLGLLLGDIVGRGSGSATIARAIVLEDREVLRNIHWSKIKKNALEFTRFPMYSSPAALLHTSVSSIPIFLFTSLYSPEIAGFFIFAQRAVWAPLSFLSVSVGQVYFGEMSNQSRSNGANILGLFKNITSHLFLIGVAPTILVFILSPIVFPLVFGIEWAESGLYARIFCLAWFVQFLVTPTFHTLNALGKNHWLLIADFIGMLIITASIYMSWRLHYPPSTAVCAYAVSISMLYSMLFILTWIAIVATSRSENAPPEA